MPTTTVTPRLTAVRLPAAGRVGHPSSAVTDFVIGLVLAAVLPALFWMAAFAGLAALFGWPIAPSALLMAGAAIAGFLGVFFAALYTRAT